jgi:hypothetical protein
MQGFSVTCLINANQELASYSLVYASETVHEVSSYG